MRVAVFYPFRANTLLMMVMVLELVMLVLMLVLTYARMDRIEKSACVRRRAER